jgi:hypothetical protein
MPFKISSISSSSELSEKSATAEHGIPGGEVLKREIEAIRCISLRKSDIKNFEHLKNMK